MFDQEYNDWDDFDNIDNSIHPTGVIAPVDLMTSMQPNAPISHITNMSQMSTLHSNLSTSFPSNIQSGFVNTNNNPGMNNNFFASDVDGYKYHDIPNNYHNNAYSELNSVTNSIPNSISSNVASNVEDGYDFNFMPDLLQDSVSEFSSVNVSNQYLGQPYQKRHLQNMHSFNEYIPNQQQTPKIENQIIKQEPQNPFINQEYVPSPYMAQNTSLSQPSKDYHFSQENMNEDRNNDSSFPKRYRVVRGISAGGCTTRPPKHSVDSDSIFLLTELNLVGASVEDICYPVWSQAEKEDRRRIVRIERIQKGPRLIVNFSIVGAAKESPVPVQPPPGVDVVEVSCLECTLRNDDYDSQSSDDELKSPPAGSNCTQTENGECYQYYITSVEVIEIVELLIANQSKDPAERRRERGRVRSNLVPFWSKKPISSRMNDANTSENDNLDGHTPTNQDYRLELAKRIMGYEIRKPRGFDKEVRILRWDKLVPALKRALQSYYTEIPLCDAHLEFN